MPVIKSIGRKDTKFNQLINYLHRLDGGEQDTFTYLHNMPGTAPDDLQKMEQAFMQNNQYRKQRKGGVGQYHEVMSFHPDDTKYLLEHPEVLEDLAKVYLDLRASDAIAIARPHTDKEHLHLHFMIGANELKSSKSIRLSKQRFEAIRRGIETYQLKQYPELTSSYVHSRDKEKYRGKDKAIEQSYKQRQMEKRGFELKDKKAISATVKTLLDSTDDLNVFKQILGDYDIKTYHYKGRLQGVVFNGRKYRFNRLIEKDGSQMKVVERWNQARQWERGLDIER